jgi:hypothetical protein|tara:strand:- start:54 stop:317 length:264 start_codon:yes stop_codon:yes gene_type:complete
MIKNLLVIFCLIFSCIFFYLVFDKYLSIENKKQINLNRLNISKNIIKKSSDLLVLKNDTSNVIEFNSGYNEEINKKNKRSFWSLFDK